MVLTVTMIGSLEVGLNGRFLHHTLTSSKAKGLLCYLVLHPQSHTRQSLAGFLWGDSPEADARRNLRGVLHKLRHALGEQYFQVETHTITFNTHAPYWADVPAFLQTTASSSIPDLKQAIQLYRGGFLADVQVRHAPEFELWVEQQQEQLEQHFIALLYALADQYRQQNQMKEGIPIAQKLLQQNPIHESGHRLLMWLLAMDGQRSAALRQYEVCRQLLQKELNMVPSSETMLLLEQIRSDSLPSTQPAYMTALSTAVSISPRLPLVTNEQPTFIAGPPILHPHQFFGRERELKRLFNLLKRIPMQNAAIIGSRRSGKTSLLHYLRQISTVDASRLRTGQRTDWLPQATGYQWVFVDFQDPRMGEQEALLAHLLTQMNLTVPHPCTLESFMDVVADELRQPTVVLLDEIGVALGRYAQLDDMFWESLRSLATNWVGGLLAFVLTSDESPAQLAQHTGYGSPFFNIFGYTARLGALTEAEARTLIASSPIPFAPEVVAWMLEVSGGWPLLLQILCREHLLALEEEESDWQEEALRQMEPFKTGLMPDA